MKKHSTPFEFKIDKNDVQFLYLNGTKLPEQDEAKPRIMTTQEIHDLNNELSNVKMELMTLKWMLKWTSKFISIPPVIQDQLNVTVKTLERCQHQQCDRIDSLSNPSQNEHESTHHSTRCSHPVDFGPPI